MPFPLLLHRLLTFGRRSEILVIDYVRSLGYRVVSSGYRTKGGEVNIIAWDGEILVLIEAKARHSSEPPEDSVGALNQQRIIRAVRAYISRFRLENVGCRFDILAVSTVPGAGSEFHLLRDAFRMYN